MTFILTFYWFKEFESGKKKAEFRRANDYWKKTLAKLNSGDSVLLRKGYSHTYIKRIVDSVETVEGWELPEAERKFFNAANDELFIKVLFK